MSEDKSACAWLKCKHWGGNVCNDPQEYVNLAGDLVCGRRSDAIPLDRYKELNQEISDLKAQLADMTQAVLIKHERAEKAEVINIDTLKKEEK